MVYFLWSGQTQKKTFNRVVITVNIGYFNCLSSQCFSTIRYSSILLKFLNCLFVKISHHRLRNHTPNLNGICISLFTLQNFHGICYLNYEPRFRNLNVLKTLSFSILSFLENIYYGILWPFNVFYHFRVSKN